MHLRLPGFSSPGSHFSVHSFWPCILAFSPVAAYRNFSVSAANPGSARQKPQVLIG